jgi:hypothetical protein
MNRIIRGIEVEDHESAGFSYQTMHQLIYNILYLLNFSDPSGTRWCYLHSAPQQRTDKFRLELEGCQQQ